MNTICLIGHVDSEPEHSITQNGHSTCTFRLAPNCPDNTASQFAVVDVLAYDGQADLARHLTLGRRIGIEGRIASVIAYGDGSSSYRESVEIIADRIELPADRASR